MCPWPAQKGNKSQSGHLLPAGKKPVSRRDRDARRLPSHIAATAECFRDLSACCPLSSVKCQHKPANLEPGSTTCKQKSQTKETSTLQTFTYCPQYSNQTIKYRIQTIIFDCKQLITKKQIQPRVYDEIWVLRNNPVQYWIMWYFSSAQKSFKHPSKNIFIIYLLQTLY